MFETMKLIVEVSILFFLFTSCSAQVSIVNGNDAAVGETPFIVQFRYIIDKSHGCAGSYNTQFL